MTLKRLKLFQSTDFASDMAVKSLAEVVANAINLEYMGISEQGYN